MDYLKILRPKNLILVAISQVLIYMQYLYQVLGGVITLDNELWLLFILDTVIIAGSGYVINDIFDAKADQTNKIDKAYIGNERISIKKAKIYYSILVFVGLGIAWYIAAQIDKFHLLVIYPIAVGLLFLYSYKWKGSVLVGNVVVATFCAFVPGIVLYAEIDNILVLQNQYPSIYQYFSFVFVGYILFAFFSTMVREIVKDIEDRVGDEEVGYMTLPIVYGAKKAKEIALIMGFCLLITYVLWIFPMIQYSFIVIGLVLVLLVLPTLFILLKIATAKTTQDYAHISSQLKWIMIVSLIVFLCIPYL